MRVKSVPVAKKKVKYRQYNGKLLEQAYETVQQGTNSVNRAAVSFGVPVTTLKDRISGRISLSTTSGGQHPLLSTSEERDIVEHIRYMASVGYGYSRLDLRHIATDVAVYLGKKAANEIFSDNWVTRFLKRWPTLKLCKPRSLEWIRAANANCQVIDKYYRDLNNTMTENNLHDKPHLIYNIDETGVTTEHKPTRVIAEASSKPQSIVSPRSGTTTIIACGNAMGTALPPFFVFKGKRFTEELLENKTPGTAAVMSDSGWSNSTIFRDYLEKHFMKYAQKPQESSQKMLILYDGHKSHVCKPVIDWARENNIVLFTLPPHCSHILQPLDIGCFSPLKSKFNHECQIFLRSNPGRQITRYDVCSLACKAYEKGLTPSNLVSAFRKAGICPLDRSKISDQQLAPSTILADNDHTEVQITADTDVAAIESSSDGNIPQSQNITKVAEVEITTVSQNDTTKTTEKSASTFLKRKIPVNKGLRRAQHNTTAACRP